MKPVSGRQIYLRSWGNAWILHTLDPVTGNHSWERIVRDRRDEPRTNGFASIEPVFGLVPRFYAIYAVEGRLYFQAGARKWDVTEGQVETFHWSWFGLTSGFRLLLAGKTVHNVILVHPNRAVWPFVDPTYDDIDFESDHFLWFVSRNLTRGDWREHILEMERKRNTDAPT